MPADWFFSILHAHVPTDREFTIHDVSAAATDDLLAQPELLLDALRDGLLEELVRQKIGQISRARLGYFRKTRVRRSFVAAVQRSAETGSTAPLDIFREKSYAVDPSNTRKPLGQMTREDHRFVAGRYTSASQNALLLSRFHQRIADQLKAGQVTADVFSVDTYVELYRSITGTSAVAPKLVAIR